MKSVGSVQEIARGFSADLASSCYEPVSDMKILNDAYVDFQANNLDFAKYIMVTFLF